MNAEKSGGVRLVCRYVMPAIYTIMILFSGIVYSNDESDYGIDRNAMPIDAISSYCDIDDFLSSLGIDSDMCAKLINKYSNGCIDIIFPIVPKIDVTESKDKIFAIGKSIGHVYILCLKSYLYEDVFGVPNY